MAGRAPPAVQFGGLGMAQPVGLAEPQWPPGAIGEAVDVIEAAQHDAVGIAAAGPTTLERKPHSQK
jgi:hypothetical protein